MHAEAKRFSLGASESGALAYRISGPNNAEPQQTGAQVQGLPRQVPGVTGARDDWGTRMPRVDVQIDQRKARRQCRGRRWPP